MPPVAPENVFISLSACSSPSPALRRACRPVFSHHAHHPAVETVKIVMSCEALTIFRILSNVSFENVSRPLEIRMMYLRPSTSAAGPALVQRVEHIRFPEAGITSELIPCRICRLSCVKSVMICVFMSNVIIAT